jgi:hypothetical protein
MKISVNINGPAKLALRNVPPGECYVYECEPDTVYMRGFNAGSFVAEVCLHDGCVDLLGYSDSGVEVVLVRAALEVTA